MSNLTFLENVKINPNTCRYSNTLKSESGEHHFFAEPSGTAAYGTVDSAMTSLSSCKSRDTHSLGGLSYSSYGDLMQEELGQVVTISSLPREQEKPPPHSFLGYGFRHEEPVKPENQLLRPFFDEWPKNRESWLEFESERSNRNSSFSTTRLSISIPMGSSASSPNGNIFDSLRNASVNFCCAPFFFLMLRVYR